jgi:hypothetical protein
MKRFIFVLIVFGFMGSVGYADSILWPEDNSIRDALDREREYRQEQQMEEQRRDIERNRSMMDAMESRQRAREQTERLRRQSDELYR